MTSFRFPLERVLAWRRTQLEMAEMLLRRKRDAVAEVDRARAEIQAEAVRAELQVRSQGRLEGRDLAALAEFRSHVGRVEGRLAARRAEAGREAEALQSAMLEARRRCRLLERLRERRLEQWTEARDREIEELASESFLARWTRRL